MLQKSFAEQYTNLVRRAYRLRLKQAEHEMCMFNTFGGKNLCVKAVVVEIG